MDTVSITMIWRTGAKSPGLFFGWNYLDVLRLNKGKLGIDFLGFPWYNLVTR